MTERIHFQYAIYYLPKVSGDPHQALREQVAKSGMALKIVAAPSHQPTDAEVLFHLENDVQGKYKPPSVETLGYFGRGLSTAQAKALQVSEQALVLDFLHPKRMVWTALAAANQLVEQMARDGGGLIWDEETREVFTPDAWHVRRNFELKAGIPNVAAQTTIHAYQHGQLIRAITLGMGKFGLPDVVINDFSWSLNNPIGYLITAFCQAMAEGATFEKAGQFDLDLHAIRSPAFTQATASITVNAGATAHLTLKKGVAEEGDPENRLIEITAARYPGLDQQARLDSMATSLFQWGPRAVAVKDNAPLEEASRRARSRLPALKISFAAGLKPGESILVKAPFSAPGAHPEYMWVKVTRWSGDAIEGMLENEPMEIATLHAGQMVTVKEGEVFDYIRKFPDGREEGNETGRIIKAKQDR